MAERKMPTEADIEEKLASDFRLNEKKYSTEKKDKGIKPVVSDSSHIKTRDKSFAKKFAETFLSDDIENVKEYTIKDVIVPAIKETIASVVIGGIEMLLFGSTRSNQKKSNGYVSYSNFYNNNQRRSSDRDSRNKTVDYKEIILESRAEAEDVLSALVDLTIDYGSASIADLYELVGVIGNFTDNKYGWTDLSRASVKRVREGYLVVLPKAILLD